MSEVSAKKDFKTIDILEGETPDDINQKCLNLCKDYLDGIWSELEVKDIVVHRISGGFSNMLFHCSAEGTGITPTGDEPIDVVIRLYGEKHFTNGYEGRLNRHNDSMVSLLMSERGLSPKIYGCSPEGQILEFIKVSSLRRVQ